MNIQTLIKQDYIWGVHLPWPNKVLSPNARVHWAALSKAKKKARGDAKYAALAAGVQPVEANSIKITRIYSPPNRRRRDKDNLDAMTKAHLDGLADALGVDDSIFDLEKSHILEPVKDGNICFLIQEITPPIGSIEDDGFVTITPTGGI